MSLRVSSLHIYPVKSCRGVSVDRMECTPFGPRDDRRWMVVERDGTFVTQRADPVLAQVETAIREDGVAVAFGADEVVLPRLEGEGDRDVTVWRSELAARDVGDRAAEFFSNVVGRSVRVVYMSDENVRYSNPEHAGEGRRVSFADGYPYLLTNEGSLDDLSARCGEPLEMSRFRPNIVVDGATPWAEDGWREVVIGGSTFELVKPCGRCSMTTLDPVDGRRTGPEPLRALATFRNWDGEVMFGWNAIGPDSGDIEIGQSIDATLRESRNLTT